MGMSAHVSTRALIWAHMGSDWAQEGERWVLALRSSCNFSISPKVRDCLISGEPLIGSASQICRRETRGQ